MMSRICEPAIALQFGCPAVCGAAPTNSKSTATVLDRIREDVRAGQYGNDLSVIRDDP
jgi:hypothetical protein